MSDLQRYIATRKVTDPVFTTNFDTGYNNFRTMVLVQQKHVSVQPVRKQVTQLRRSCDEGRESQDGC